MSEDEPHGLQEHPAVERDLDLSDARRVCQQAIAVLTHQLEILANGVGEETDYDRQGVEHLSHVTGQLLRLLRELERMAPAKPAAAQVATSTAPVDLAEIPVVHLVAALERLPLLSRLAIRRALLQPQSGAAAGSADR